MAYHRILLPNITYPLEVTTFTKKDTKQMQTLTDKTYKTQMKLNRNFPQAVYRGTPRYGGLGMVPITTHQAYKQMQLLIGCIRNGDSGGDLAQQSLEYLQLEAGTSKSVLHPTHRTYQKFLEDYSAVLVANLHFDVCMLML